MRVLYAFLPCEFEKHGRFPPKVWGSFRNGEPVNSDSFEKDSDFTSACLLLSEATGIPQSSSGSSGLLLKETQGEQEDRRHG